jgi:hypothetical protein
MTGKLTVFQNVGAEGLTVLQNAGLSGPFPTRSTISFASVGPQGIPGPVGPSGEGADPIDLWYLLGDSSITFTRFAQSAIDDSTLQSWGAYTCPDLNAAGFLVGATGITRRYNASPNDPRLVFVTTVDGDDSWAAPRDFVEIIDPDLDCDWLSGGAIVDLGGGVGMMVLHCERNGENNSFAYWDHHVAKVVDDGTTVTITHLGEIVTHAITEEYAETNGVLAYNSGGQLVVWNDYVYVYGSDHSEEGAYATVARCSVADVAAALAADTAPVFHKWLGESLDEEWTEPAIGGAPVFPVTSQRLASVAYDVDFIVTPDNRILAVGIGALDGTSGLYAVTGSDPLTWSDRLFFERFTEPGEHVYPSLWSGDAASAKEVTGKTIELSYLYSDGNPSRWEGQYEVRQQTLFPSVLGTKFPLQPMHGYFTDQSNDLTTWTEGFLIALSGTTQTLPEIEPDTAGWEILNGSESGVVTVEAFTPTPINNAGDIEIAPGECYAFRPYQDANVWIAYQTSAGDGSGVSSHGDLDNLDADDHLQYQRSESVTVGDDFTITSESMVLVAEPDVTVTLPDGDSNDGRSVTILAGASTAIVVPAGTDVINDGLTTLTIPAGNNVALTSTNVAGTRIWIITTTTGNATSIPEWIDEAGIDEGDVIAISGGVPAWVPGDPVPTVVGDVFTAVRAGDPVEGTAYDNSGDNLSSLIGVDETWPVELTLWDDAPGFYEELGEVGAAPTDPFMIGVILSTGDGPGLNSGDVVVGATVTLDVTGNDTVIIAGMRPVNSTKFLPGSSDAPLTGFESKAIGKHVGPAAAGTTVFSLALDAPYVIGPDADENDPSIELLAYNLNDGSTINVTDVSWLVANGDIEADWRPPEPQGAVKAAAILLTPSLTPEVGDEIWSVVYRPGSTSLSSPTDTNPDFFKMDEYTYTGLWEPDPGDVVLLMIDEGEGGQQDTWPSVYARFTATGFEPIELAGGTLVSISCGGSGWEVPALFVGSNWDNPIVGVTWPLGPAEFFQPLTVSAERTYTHGDYTGNITGTLTVQEALDAVDALSLTGSSTYYPQAAITLQPWSQGDIDLDGPSGFVDAIVVTSDSPYYVQATVNFTATADVIAEATTGDPEFLIDVLFRSLDASFSGWIWGIGGQNLTTPVHGVFGGLPFVGSVHRDGSILDANGDQVFRTIKDGDTLAGTITGVFNAD